MGHGVVQRRVPVAVGHVDHKLQQLGRAGGEGVHVEPHQGRVCRLVAGDAQPLLQDAGVGRPLDRAQEGTQALGWDIIFFIY